MTWLDDHKHLDKYIDKGTDSELEAAIELAELDLGDVSMADAVGKFRQIARVHGSCLSCLQKLAEWLKARNIPRDPNVMSLHNAALAAADEARIASENAEAAATATQAEREVAEAAAKAANDKAKEALVALAEKKAEERLRARLGRPPEG